MDLLKVGRWCTRKVRSWGYHVAKSINYKSEGKRSVLRRRWKRFEGRTQADGYGNYANRGSVRLWVSSGDHVAGEADCQRCRNKLVLSSYMHSALHQLGAWLRRLAWASISPRAMVFDFVPEMQKSMPALSLTVSLFSSFLGECSIWGEWGV